MVYVFFIAVSFLIEAKVSFLGIRPDATAILIYYFGLRNGPVGGLLFGAFIGILADSLSGGIIGPNILSKGMVGYFSAVFIAKIFKWTPFIGILGLAVLTAMDRTASLISYSVFEHMPSSPLIVIYTIAGQALINCPLGFFLRAKDED